jgi:uncharacterized linocin/CFP29 family protein
LIQRRSQSLGWDIETEIADALLAFEFMESDDVIKLTRSNKPVPILQRGFKVGRRDLASSKIRGDPLNVRTAVSAAYKVQLKEEALLIQGYTADGTTYDIKGLYQSANNTFGGATWATAANIILAINAAIGALIVDKIYPPYNCVLHPDQWAETGVLISGSAKSHREWIKESMQGGDVYVSPTITAGTGMVLATKEQGHFDFGVPVDLKHEEVIHPVTKNLHGLVFECLLPRVFDTNAICTITGI